MLLAGDPSFFEGCRDPPVAAVESGIGDFRYAVRKQYVAPSGSTFVNADDDTGMMQITVEVGWGGDSFDDNEFTATDIKAR